MARAESHRGGFFYAIFELRRVTAAYLGSTPLERTWTHPFGALAEEPFFG